MANYRKKPVVIEAWQFQGGWDSALSIMQSAGVTGEDDERMLWSHSGDDEVGQIEIPTLEGTMRADKGDWIIKGVKGELYPCKPDIFAATYEPADGPGTDPYHH
jgi:hypothetical protein